MDGLPEPPSFKVHFRLCSELQDMVVRVSNIIPEIEAARPRSLGLEALCLLNTNGITQANSLLQQCSESSIIYLVLTGDKFVSRCRQSRNIVEHCLSQIQNTVLMTLARKISEVILAIKSAVYSLDPPEEEARNILRDLFCTCGNSKDSTVTYELSAIRAICSRLQISSREALMTEKRAIRKLIDKFGKSDRTKILLFFHRLLDKYIKSTTNEQCRATGCEDGLQFTEFQARIQSDKASTDMSSRSLPPVDYLCPLSARLMHDPVIISSGETYERSWIQKWFDEGHDTCPKTNVKLEHFSITPNVILKHIISKWWKAQDFSTPATKSLKRLVNTW